MIFLNKPGKNKTSDSYIRSHYYLYDKFTTALAAGAVNATLAEPVGGARMVVDTNNKISIANNLLTFAAGCALNDGVRWPSQARATGRTILGTVNLSAFGVQFGFDVNTSTGLTDFMWVRADNSTLYITSTTVINLIVGAVSATTYQLAVTQRATGSWYFIKGGTFTNWTMVYASLTGSSNPMYPAITVSSASSVLTADNIRVSKQAYIPVPLQSDGMSAAITDGLGNPENNGTTGNAYTNVGTWGVAGGVRSCSALSGGIGFSYLTATSSNVIIQAVCTRSAGVTGLVARYVDASNYLIAYHDGTNAKLDKVVAGVTTNLLTAVVAYGATKVMSLHLMDTAARLFYGDAVVGTVAVTPAAGSLNHGMYTTDTGATFDNLVIWAKGNEGQYGVLNNL